MLKILIISGYAYPTQAPRSFRTSELAEQLIRMGHSVTVYSPLGNYDYCSYEKETGVTMKDIPSFLSLPRPNQEGERNIVTKILWRLLSRWVMIPDIEYVYRVNKILKKEHDIDLLITIAAPHMIHIGAARFKKHNQKAFPLVWIADSGDPCFLNPMHHFPNYMARLEKQWCKLCDYITVPTEESRKGYFPEFVSKIEVIPQGFDFSKTPADIYTPNGIPTFAFAGRLYPGQRDLDSFMEYLLTLDIDYKFKIITFSKVDPSFIRRSQGRIEIIPGMPRKEVIKELSRCDFVVNISNPNIVQTPSKLIDYGLCARPVLNISNEFKEYEILGKFLSGDYSMALTIPDMDQYRIENVASNFLSLYHSAV